MSAVLFATLIWKVVDFLRMLTNLRQQVSGVVTQLCSWVGGVVLVAIAAHASVTSNVTLPGLDRPLHGLDGASIVLVGLLASSLASSLVDVKAAIDNTDSAKKPALLPPAPPVPPAA